MFPKYQPETIAPTIVLLLAYLFSELKQMKLFLGNKTLSQLKMDHRTKNKRQIYKTSGRKDRRKSSGSWVRQRFYTYAMKSIIQERKKN